MSERPQDIPVKKLILALLAISFGTIIEWVRGSCHVDTMCHQIRDAARPKLLVRTPAGTAVSCVFFALETLGVTRDRNT